MGEVRGYTEDDYTAQHNPVWGEGLTPSRVMVVGEAPGEEENARGRPFIGLSGKWLRSLLAWAGCPATNCYITNLVKRWPGPGNPDPDGAAIDEWSQTLRDEIRACNPEIIVAVGRIAASWFLQRPVVMEIDHGIPVSATATARTSTVLPIYHPAALFRQPSLGSRLMWDMRQLRAWLEGGHVWTRRRDPSCVSQLVEGDLGQEASIIGLDSEGTPDKPWCVSMSPRHGEAYVVRGGKLICQADILLGQYILWDFPVWRALGVELYGKLLDTCVGAFCLQSEPQGLKESVLRWYGHHMPHYRELVAPHVEQARIKFLQQAWAHLSASSEDRPMAFKRVSAVMKDRAKGKAVNVENRWKAWTEEVKEDLERAAGREWPEPSMDLVPMAEAVQYAGEDAAYTRRWFIDVLQPRLELEGLWDVFELDCAVLPMIERMQTVGLLVDYQHFHDLGEELGNQVEQLEVGFLEKYGVDPGNPDHVAEYLFGENGAGLTPVHVTAKKKRPSTGKKSLEVLKGQHQAVDDITAYRSAIKMKSTYVDPALEAAIVGDGRLHPRFGFIGGRREDVSEETSLTVTGRLRVQGYPALGIPKRSALGKRVRKGFIARPGYVLVSVDLSQIELRILAHISQDPILLEIFRSGGDLHARTMEACNLPREPAKNVNFGIVYGISPEGLLAQFQMNHARKADGSEFTIEDCEAIIATWYATYKGVPAYYRKVEQQVLENGFVRGLSGRIRYCAEAFSPRRWMREKALREAGNFPIQEAAAFIIKRAMKRLWEYDLPKLWAEGVGVECLLQVHDELLLEVQEGWEYCVAAIVACQMTADAHMFDVPILASASMGKSWGEMKAA